MLIPGWGGWKRIIFEAGKKELEHRESLFILITASTCDEVEACFISIVRFRKWDTEVPCLASIYVRMHHARKFGLVTCFRMLVDVQHEVLPFFGFAGVMIPPTV
jgi:hypothetical protein